MKSKKRFLVLVQAGSKDWEPTPADMQDLADLYREAMDELYPKRKDAGYAIVVTRHDIKAQVRDLSKSGVSIRDSRKMRELILEALGKKKGKKVTGERMKVIDLS